MAQFQLDTSGVIDMEPGEAVDRGHLISWSDLSPFTQGYIEALFASVCPDEDGSREMRTPAFSDLAPETLARIIADCEAWRDEYSDHVRVASGHRPDMGHEFWRIRQTGARSTFPPLTVQLGDDGKVRFAGAAA